MMILWEQKLAFLAVPKTGSTAIEGALAPHSAILFRNPPSLKHMNLNGFVKFFDRYLKDSGINDIETMAIMREPVDWLSSWYRYRRRAQLSGKRNSTENVSFDDFVQAYCQEDTRPNYAKVGCQSYFLSGGSAGASGIHIDHLFSYAHLDQAVAFLEARIEKPIKLNRLNVSPKIDGLKLSADTQALYERRFAADFELYHSISRIGGSGR